MIALGEILTDVSGRSYRVMSELGMGGQGTVYDVSETKTGYSFVAKIYHPTYATLEAAERLSALTRLNLSSASPALCGPVSRLQDCHGLGAVQPKVEGAPLEEVFASPTYSLVDGIAISLAICKAVAVLESHGVAHGDIAATNVMVRETNGVYRVFLIDLDNAMLPGAPKPSFLGQYLYAAPEMLIGSATASLETDRFALGVLLYEILLRRHPFTVMRGQLTFQEYCRLLVGAKWLEDPTDAQWTAPSDAWPIGSLSRAIHDLFRRALSANPGVRPSADAWATTLAIALSAVYECVGCGQHHVNEPTRFACVSCGRAAETLELHIAGKVIRFDRLYRTVGRADLGNDPTVSREHAVFRRNGFGLRVQNLSHNGLSVVAEGRRLLLSQGDEADVQAHDRVEFATGLEGLLVACPSH